ncbi:MAG TPA: HAMP domain-containing protein [Candidatus Omnitrophica bacterium]|nr:MAG: hypothetical protein DRP61_01730 [Candidatus Omnitrophota bacterium]RKY35273.1 MAG: hypothetical protein DRP69_02005 [Candidatus Omnitrophota bacterium]RKY42552.1 MAG: hypothetical protein DRP80_06665 [Candidatus Omnitrophota bacterium]HEC68759.1 HAMP domain-containing protein [Candidatus Omnitrophota bacterium]
MRRIRRKQYFIDKGFQTKFIIKFCLIVILASFLITTLIFLFSKNSTTTAIENTKVIVKRTSDFILPLLVGVVLIVSVFSSLIVIIVTLFTSHKIAGPLYRLKKEIEAFSQGDFNRDFKIRSSDQLKELSQSLQNMRNLLVERNLRIKTKIEILKGKLEKVNINSKEELLRDLDDLEKEIG